MVWKQICTKRTFCICRKKGEQVASPLITVIDDGTLKGQFGTMGYDDEGTPCQKKCSD